MTEENFVAGYLVTSWRRAAAGPGLYVVDWEHLADGLGSWYSREPPPVQVTDYGHAAQLWARAGCRGPITRIA